MEVWVLGFCAVRVCWFWLSCDHRGAPQESPKDPDPPARIGRRILNCALVRVEYRVRKAASHRRQTQVTGDKVRNSGGHSLARARTSDDQRSPFLSSLAGQGVWAQQPLVQPMGRRPYPSGRHLPHVNFVCRVTPSISALHPNAVDRALAGRALSGHPGGSYPLDLVRPTRKGDIRLIFFFFSPLSLSLSVFSHSSTQLGSPCFTFLTRRGHINWDAKRLFLLSRP